MFGPLRGFVFWFLFGCGIFAWHATQEGLHYIIVPFMGWLTAMFLVYKYIMHKETRSTSNENELRVMTWNVAASNTPMPWEERVTFIERQIESKNPDIVLLQDTRLDDTDWASFMYWRGYDGIEQQDHTCRLCGLATYWKRDRLDAMGLPVHTGYSLECALRLSNRKRPSAEPLDFDVINVHLKAPGNDRDERIERIKKCLSRADQPNRLIGGDFSHQVLGGTPICVFMEEEGFAGRGNEHASYFNGTDYVQHDHVMLSSRGELMVSASDVTRSGYMVLQGPIPDAYNPSNHLAIAVTMTLDRIH